MAPRNAMRTRRFANSRFGVSRGASAAAASWFKVPLTWKVSTYHFYVYATNAAGNAQSSVGKNRLVVR